MPPGAWPGGQRIPPAVAECPAWRRAALTSVNWARDCGLLTQVKAHCRRFAAIYAAVPPLERRHARPYHARRQRRDCQPARQGCRSSRHRGRQPVPGSRLPAGGAADRRAAAQHHRHAGRRAKTLMSCRGSAGTSPTRSPSSHVASICRCLTSWSARCRRDHGLAGAAGPRPEARAPAARETWHRHDRQARSGGEGRQAADRAGHWTWHRSEGAARHLRGRRARCRGPNWQSPNRSLSLCCVISGRPTACCRLRSREATGGGAKPSATSISWSQPNRAGRSCSGSSATRTWRRSSSRGQPARPSGCATAFRWICAWCRRRATAPPSATSPDPRRITSRCARSPSIKA